MLLQNAASGGSFWKLIYDYMGYGPDSYQRLYECGGMRIINLLSSALDNEGWGDDETI